RIVAAVPCLLCEGCLFLRPLAWTAAAQCDGKTLRGGSNIELHAVLIFHLQSRTSAGNSHGRACPDVVAVEVGEALKIVDFSRGRASADAHFAHGNTTDRDWIFLALVGKRSAPR